MTDNESPNPQRRGLKKGLYLLPSAFTAANILMGFFTIMAALRAYQLIGLGDIAHAVPYLDNGAKAIGWALAFDMLDGRIARLTKTTTEIGVQLDSLADVVTFGIAPAVLAYVWGYGVTFREGSDLYNIAFFISFMYLMCGVFRLARFNVQSSRPRILAEGTIKTDKKSFVGLPIPVAGGLIAALVHFAPTPLISYERAQLYSLLLLVLTAVLSVLMVSTLRFSSFKTVGTKTRSMRVIILGVAIGMLIIMFSRYVLLAIVIAYILYGLLARVSGLFRRRTDMSNANLPAKET